MLKTLDPWKWLEERGQECLPIILWNEDGTSFITYKLWDVDSCLCTSCDCTNNIIKTGDSCSAIALFK